MDTLNRVYRVEFGRARHPEPKHAALDSEFSANNDLYTVAIKADASSAHLPAELSTQV